jgi:hypothetical protein
MKLTSALLAVTSAINVCNHECYWESPTGAKGSPNPEGYCQEANNAICQYAQATTAGYQPADSFDCPKTCAQVDPKTGKCFENPGSTEPPVNNKCFCKTVPADPYSFCTPPNTPFQIDLSTRPTAEKSLRSAADPSCAKIHAKPQEDHPGVPQKDAEAKCKTDCAQPGYSCSVIEQAYPELCSCRDSPAKTILRTQTLSTSYDQRYDSKSASLNTVSCSDGQHGLAAKYPTFGSLPKFPFIGGMPMVAGWNSENCGTCWKVSYNGTSINVLAVDHAQGENLSLEAMNALTNGLAVQLGRVQSTVVQVDKSACGL